MNEEQSQKQQIIGLELIKILDKHKTNQAEDLHIITTLLSAILECSCGFPIDAGELSRHIIKFVKRNKCLSDTSKENMFQC